MTNPTNRGGELKGKEGGKMSEIKRWFNNGNGEMADICNPSDTQPGFGTGPWVNYCDVMEMKDIHQETLSRLSAAKETIERLDKELLEERDSDNCGYDESVIHELRQENAALEAKMAQVKAHWENLELIRGDRGEEAYIKKMDGILSESRPALAVVEGLAKTNNIAGGSLFYGDQLAIWRDSECIHPDWEPVTVVVLERSSNAKQGAV